VTAVNVLVVFYSTGGETERLALTAGVGAIQARANIRLRRLPPGPEVQPPAMTPQQRENFERMSRDYVAPRPDDPLWADAVILGTSPEGAGALEAYVEGVPRLGPVAGKIAAPVATGTLPNILRPIYAAAAQAGLTVVPMPPTLASTEAQHAFGRQVVAFARALKSAQAP
jgi:NAD(P)H dehydrogenase (quinone)